MWLNQSRRNQSATTSADQLQLLTPAVQHFIKLWIVICYLALKMILHYSECLEFRQCNYLFRAEKCLRNGRQFEMLVAERQDRGSRALSTAGTDSNRVLSFLYGRSPKHEMVFSKMDKERRNLFLRRTIQILAYHDIYCFRNYSEN